MQTLGAFHAKKISEGTLYSFTDSVKESSGIYLGQFHILFFFFFFLNINAAPSVASPLLALRDKHSND